MQSYEAVKASPLAWYKASFCQNRECVEVTEINGLVLMRSSAEPDSGYINLTAKEFGSFLTAAKAGEFDVP
jgi:hypothetical protein